MTTLTYVKGAERMITAARLGRDGLYVRFADEQEGVVPVADLRLAGTPEYVTVPRPHVVEIHLADGGVEELPWDFIRHFVDERHREVADRAAARGRHLMGTRLRALRSGKGVTQEELAAASGMSRVSIARIETGRQLPRYQTLVALAEALELPIERLLVG